MPVLDAADAVETHARDLLRCCLVRPLGDVDSFVTHVRIPRIVAIGVIPAPQPAGLDSWHQRFPKTVVPRALELYRIVCYTLAIREVFHRHNVVERRAG